MPRIARITSLDDKRRNLIQIIVEARNRLALTQEEAAERCGFSTSYFSMVETGRRIPKTDYLFRVLKGLDIPLDIVMAYVPEEMRPLLISDGGHGGHDHLDHDTGETLVSQALASLPRMPLIESLLPTQVDVYGGLVLPSLGLPEEALTYYYPPTPPEKGSFALKAHPKDTDSPMKGAALFIIVPSLGLRNDNLVVQVRQDGHFLRKLLIEGPYHTLMSSSRPSIFSEEDLKRERKARTIALLPVGEIHLKLYN